MILSMDILPIQRFYEVFQGFIRNSESFFQKTQIGNVVLLRKKRENSIGGHLQIK